MFTSIFEIRFFFVLVTNSICLKYCVFDKPDRYLSLFASRKIFEGTENTEHMREQERERERVLCAAVTYKVGPLVIVCHKLQNIKDYVYDYSTSRKS